MSSGVRNLRAMFEQNNAASASPEPRGRSPGSSSAADDSSRPTSKVRASFVSVEHTIPHASDFGANKGTPSNSTAAHRRESFSISEDTGGEVADLKRIISEEKEERRKSVAIIDPVPEQAVASRESSAGPPPIRNEPEGEMVNLGAIMKGSDFPETAADTGAGAPQPNETPAPAPAPELASVKEEPVKEEAVIEEEPVEEEPLKEEPAPAPVQETPAENPDKAVTGAQEEVSLKPADPTDASAVAGGKALPSPAEELQPASTETAPAAPIEPAEPAAETPKPAASSAKLNGTPTTKGKLDVKKPAAISTTKASASKGTPVKSPLPKTAPKTPTTPKHSAAAPVSKPAATSRPAAAAATAKPAVKRAASREPPKAAAPKPKTSHTSLRASTATAPTASAKAKASATETKKPATTKPKDPTTTSPTGFKKPKPRSPTRPVGLPSRLTAPTAASAAKLQGEESQKTTRKPAATTTTRPAPKPAATRPPRASVAPSASTTKRPESRTSTAGAGPSFFERMMRPTAASASKVHEKPTSPPRKAPAKSSILQKGKKKVEEVASKAKEAVTSNDHTDEPAKTETTNGTSAQHEDEEKSVAEPVSEPVVEKVDETELAKAETPVPEGESSAMELQTPNFQGEAVR